MIDFNQVHTATRIDSKFILSKLDEVQIFYYYFGHFELGKSYPSKFRADSNPSTGFYITPSKRIKYNDLATGEKLDCIGFVAKLFNISFGEACKRIALDFGLINSEKSFGVERVLSKPLIDREAKKETHIQFAPDRWQSHHIAYWNQYDIDISDLKRSEVFPVRKLFINKREIYDLDELAFAYVVRHKENGEEKIYIKIYQPYRKKDEFGKWISNIPLVIPFGMNTLKYGTDHLIVGKAQKDRMILLKLFESVIGTQNESEAAFPDKLVSHLTFNFPRRTIIWDSDATGVENSTKFNSRGFGWFNTPSHLLEHGVKDVADYVREFGLQQLEKLLKIKGIL